MHRAGFIHCIVEESHCLSSSWHCRVLLITLGRLQSSPQARSASAHGLRRSQVLSPLQVQRRSPMHVHHETARLCDLSSVVVARSVAPVLRRSEVCRMCQCCCQRPAPLRAPREPARIAAVGAAAVPTSWPSRLVLLAARHHCKPRPRRPGWLFLLCWYTFSAGSRLRGRGTPHGSSWAASPCAPCLFFMCRFCSICLVVGPAASLVGSVCDAFARRQPLLTAAVLDLQVYAHLGRQCISVRGLHLKEFGPEYDGSSSAWQGGQPMIGIPAFPCLQPAVLEGMEMPTEGSSIDLLMASAVHSYSTTAT
jgi:hypothetical protein